ncbi:Zn(II)2Cys6 transcription factor [Aspergillus thermomutatus]|uniref:Zn(2)-C6 fungal-type domain-containing protein n=1 Tax=Aspergillus thermomutatus TaxID=41047 RepID=A0A397GDD6_ASPTH|nr:uncharacterized protein CDV56_101173 [Aspergillus thermomutatus]RHZ49035.1 hypothetical protein CDV56_101173 [Aspergillus thermomutatus]
MVSPAGGKNRLRASKACQRCSRRKVKCDATERGCPCSRCRMDNVSECTLITSRRGTYDRKNFRRQVARPGPSLSSTSPPSVLPPSSRGPSTAQISPSSPSAASSGHGRVEALTPPQLLVGENRPISTPATYRQERNSNLEQPTGDTPGVDLTRPPDSVPSTFSAGSFDHRSLSAMFEDFLGQAGHEDLCKAKLVLFGEPSPLTFALQLRRDMNSGLHDANQRVLTSNSLTVVEKNVHPKHLLPHEIECLKAKGAFIYPESEVLEEMINVFLHRFYPLYSVVNPTELRKAQQERKLPWILLHSICFIAMTFCEPALIYKAGFSSRPQARQLYYDRAKALFDLNYENNKIILVKVAILLSFKGPQMDCYWNPCSWIEFGVTMAVALGMHRKSVAINGKSNDRGLLRRLWWTLAVRDAHCSALLGRPFRINMAQCDIDTLTEDDFPDEHTCRFPTTQLSCSCRESFEYQIQVTKLSIILRDIMYFRFGPTSVSFTTDLLQEQLATWKAQLPVPMQCLPGQSSVSTLAVQLDILLNYHIMLLHMEQPRRPGLNPSSLSTSLPGGYDYAAITESAALVVSSSAIKLMTRTSICNIPHEVFPGFFMAGIILYQQAQQEQNTHLAKMIRASFDNCQMLLNQAQNTWDPGVWAMKVFEFLLFAADAADAAEAQILPVDSHGFRMNTPSVDINHAPAVQPHAPGSSDVENSAWSEVPAMEFDRGLAMDMADYMLLPNFFPPTVGQLARTCGAA